MSQDNKYLMIFQDSLFKLNLIIRKLDSQLGTVSLSQEEIKALGPQCEHSPLAMIGLSNQIKEKKEIVSIDKKELNEKKPKEKKGKESVEKKEPTDKKPKEKIIPQQDPNNLFDACNLKVGKVLQAKVLEEFNDIYSLLIDIGEKEPRIIGTGLRKYVPIEQIANSKVVVFANLKPKKFGTTFVSNGMIMCASIKTNDNEIIELLRPHENAKPGDRLTLEGKPVNQEETPIITAKKFSKACELFKTDDNCNCMFNSILMQTGNQNIKVASLKNAPIS